MKRIILFTMALVVAFTTSNAAELNQSDTTFHFNKKIIHVQDSIGQVQVKVFEATNKDSIPYKVVYPRFRNRKKHYFYVLNSNA